MEFEIGTRPARCDKHGEYEQRSIPLLPGKVVWSQCPKCVEEADEKERAAAQAEDARKRQEIAEARLKHAGIPERFRDRTIDSFVAITEDQVKAKTFCADLVANWPEHRKRGRTVVLSGNPGTGKSHLAIAVLREVMRAGSGMYLNAMDLVRLVRDTWRRDSERSETQVLDTLGRLDLLVIDEVGVQYGSDGEQLVLFDVLNRRYRDLMPTILLTNLKAADFREFIGERSFDRLREDGAWLRFGWESWRGKKLQESDGAN